MSELEILKQDYANLQENYNRLLGKCNEATANELNLRIKLKNQEKYILDLRKEKDKEIKKLKEELSAYKSKQVDIFEVE